MITVVALASFLGRGAQVLEEDDGYLRFAAPDLVGVALLVTGTLVVFWWRRAPLVVLLVSSLAFFAYHEGGYAPPPLPFTPLIALYSLAAVRAAHLSLVTAGALALGVLLLFLTRNSPLTDDHFLTYVLAICAAWGLGYGVHLNRAKTALVEEAAVQAQREQEATTRLALEQERARIARDLHDVVAHHVSVIVAQATSVQKVAAAEPDRGVEALRAIESTGREALVEMRRLLGVLTPDAGRDPGDGQPGLARLEVLLANAEQAGLSTTLVTRGEPRPLPATVDVTAYRIVQEAITNALKHAGPARAEVTVGYEQDVLRLRVLDDGQGGPQPPRSGGRGLAGMYQRVALLGGSLTAGPRVGGGFEVVADLPLSGPAP